MFGYLTVCWHVNIGSTFKTLIVVMCVSNRDQLRFVPFIQKKYSSLKQRLNDISDIKLFITKKAVRFSISFIFCD